MFCVGDDICEFASDGDAFAPFLARLAGTLHQALSQFATMNKPMITQVNGTLAARSVGICARLGGQALKRRTKFANLAETQSHSGNIR